jgi:membrane-associated protease RseP (regulator of RpoE activity)
LVRGDPVYVIDGVVQPGPADKVTDTFWGSGRFGFALGCVPSCTRVKASDGGTDFYRFDSNPPVIAVVSGGVAEKAGIKQGDIVTDLDGKSVLEDDGALRFFRSNKRETLRVTVLRDRQRYDIQLRAR